MSKNLKIYYTSDTHGYIFPTDYINKEQKPMGVLSLKSSFKKDGNTLVLDGGDTIQGSAFAKYMWENQTDTNPITDVFNEVGYDYVTLGNHDFNYNYEGAYSFVKNLKAQCILANVIDHKGKLNFKPYSIRTLENGIKVGIIGIVTDYVSLWEKPEHLTHLEILDAFETMKTTLDIVRPLCDITVVIYHGGFEADIATGRILAKGKENIGYRVCKELDVDLLLTAHQHMPLEGRELFGTHVLQLPPNASKYAEINIEIDGNTKSISSNFYFPNPIDSKEISKDLLQTQDKIQHWLDQDVGCFSQAIEPISKLDMSLKGSKLADFCNKVQLEYTGADFSCTSLGNNPMGFKEQVTTRDILAAYQFPNTIKVLEIDLNTLKKALERCGEYYALENGKVEVAECFVYPKVEHYNYDFFAGFDYVFDITKPVGQRVESITINAKPLEDKNYTIAMSDYRATGTGGYEFYADCLLVKEYGIDLQELIIEYVRKQKCVVVEDVKNFEVKF